MAKEKAFDEMTIDVVKKLSAQYNLASLTFSGFRYSNDKKNDGKTEFKLLDTLQICEKSRVKGNSSNSSSHKDAAPIHSALNTNESTVWNQYKTRLKDAITADSGKGRKLKVKMDYHHETPPKMLLPIRITTIVIILFGIWMLILLYSHTLKATKSVDNPLKIWISDGEFPAYLTDIQFDEFSGFKVNDSNFNPNDRIPKKIYITHKYDICDSTIPSHLQHKMNSNDTNYFLIKDNVQRIKDFNPEFEVMCFDDKRAYNYIKSKEPKFSEYFKNEPRGMYKSDLFRIILLYHEGGYYFDSDMEPTMSLNKFIDQNATFTSVIDSQQNYIFQSYLGSIKHNPILKMSINIFDEYYSKKKTLPINCGTVFMGNALRIYTNQSSLVEIQKQEKFHDQTIHLLQEQKYNGTDAVQVLLARHDHPFYKMAVYDHQTNSYPFWSRVSGYKNSFLLVDMHSASWNMFAWILVFVVSPISISWNMFQMYKWCRNQRENEKYRVSNIKI